MKTLKATVREIELVNFILSKAISSVTHHSEIQKSIGLTNDDLKHIEAFRLRLVDTLLKTN